MISTTGPPTSLPSGATTSPPDSASDAPLTNGHTGDDADLDDLEIGSNFSWSSIDSGDKPPEYAAGHETNQTNKIIATPSSAHAADAATMKPMHKHSTHFWECIFFRVEGITFQLPKYRFVEDSAQFMELVGSKDYTSESGPIELDGISLSDFESFLKVFLPRSSAMYDDKPELTKEEWISVLKLSTQWFFNDLRQLAVGQLSSMAMDGIERICLAKEYRVYDWLLEGYSQVVDRLINVHVGPMPKPSLATIPRVLSTEEGMKIGMHVALKLSGIAILRMRESMLGWETTGGGRDILVAFHEEFGAIKREELRFLTRMEMAEVKERQRLQAEAQARRAEMQQERNKHVGRHDDGSPVPTPPEGLTTEGEKRLEDIPTQFPKRKKKGLNASRRQKVLEQPEAMELKEKAEEEDRARQMQLD